ncbi:MAG: SNF2-related protein [Verrucomicrobiae bacterium]|nr:SNF2-related protein [Verrucomicrobiae bacterium]
MSTPYHAKYFAHELTRHWPSENLEKLSQSLCNVSVDLNPHQIEAALFAFRSPLSRGAILADEVGLGKTIEAGLIISQLWAEGKRRILCILPAALRKQWNRELIEKFFLESLILETRNYQQMAKEGTAPPFEQTDRIILCSYHFARKHQDEVQRIPWDLVVVDEAHRLRNVYKKGNKIARAIRVSIENRPKVLLTATPLQNSLMELYGLVSFVDPQLFGNEDSFRDQFAKQAKEIGRTEFQELKRRIQPVCQRTLRRQVAEYIRYTNRISITQDFSPTPEELRLYEAVSNYLQQPGSFALPASQRSLMTLVLRKILASSSFAISGTLQALVNRLIGLQTKMQQEAAPDIPPEVGEDYESLDETKDEWEENESGDANGNGKAETERTDNTAAAAVTQTDLQAIGTEIQQLQDYHALAASITHNAKGDALLVALKSGFKKLADIGAECKAVIFTESRRTQKYLKELLSANGYSGQIVTFDGTNSDLDSKRLYEAWLARHADADCISGSPSADLRSALVEEFQQRASILLATESGAEGINLQFCSLVVNYDLPWNPQRIEQRIGRCHRYGQKHDVVVINFINRKNAADQRVYELLAEKFRLFDGVFGASDEVLGAIESGVDFEKRVNEIYQSCRTPDEINAAFDALQKQLEEQIRAGLEDARSKLLENFDEDVHAKLRLSKDKTRQQVSRFEDFLWRLTVHEIQDCITPDAENLRFQLNRLPAQLNPTGIPLGGYSFVTRADETAGHHYRIGHPLAVQIIERARNRSLPSCGLVFRYSDHPTKISLVEQRVGQSGWLALSLLSVTALEAEEHLLFAGQTDGGELLPPEVCARFFGVAATVEDQIAVPEPVKIALQRSTENQQNELLDVIAVRNKTHFESEMEKLENWANDLKDGLERELKELDREIKETKRQARIATELDAKVELHKKARDMERRRNDKRRGLFEAQDQVDSQKEDLIGRIESRLKRAVQSKELFVIRWKTM